jgi:predicted Ser/Thr protein kinase
MSANGFEAAPEAHHESVRAALRAAFDAAACTLHRVTGGVSALIYRFEVASRQYLLRLDTARDPVRNAERGHACMKIAADVGVAPRLYFTDSDTGVAIMDFVQQRPLSDYPNGPVALARDLGALAARLQEAALFPAVSDYPVFVGRMLEFVRGSSLFAKGLLDPHTASLQRIRDAYSWDNSALVSSHNDPNARNVLFDGKRLWLVDWETAFRNDPLADVAILLNEFGHTPEVSEAMLQGWLGRAPEAPLRARLHLMRQLTRLYYAGLILTGFAARATDTADQSLAALTPAELQCAVAEGRLGMASPQMLYALGKMMLAGYLAGVSTPEFEEALIIVKQG